MMSPKTKNCNFWQNSNPQRNTRPSSYINIRHPKMQRSSCLFPKLSCRNKPNTQSSYLRRIISCSFNNFFNMRLRCFSCLPINKSNSQKLQTTSKSTQQKIFYCRFKRICTFRVQTTKYYLRKALLFHTKVKRHLISCYNQQILTHKCLYRLIYILSMTNSSNFLPTIRNSQNKTSSNKQNYAQSLTITIFLKRTSQKNNMLRTSEYLIKRKKTPNNSPQSQCRNSMIRPSIFIFFSFSIIYFTCFHI